MKQQSTRQMGCTRQRRFREQHNLFSRLTATHAASRSRGQWVLQRAGGLSVEEWRVLWEVHEAGLKPIRDLAETGIITHETGAPGMKQGRDARKAEFTDEEAGTFAGFPDRFKSLLFRPVETVLESETAQ